MPFPDLRFEFLLFYFQILKHFVYALNGELEFQNEVRVNLRICYLSIKCSVNKMNLWGYTFLYNSFTLIYNIFT